MASCRNYLSIDTEATGLTEEALLIQLAFVPVDMKEGRVVRELGVEYLVACPTFEEMEPKLNDWVKANNRELIGKAHREGLSTDTLKTAVRDYLTKPEIKALFQDERIQLLGKSLSALDLPLLHRTFGEKFMKEFFHHHTMDVTCVARYLVDAALLPPGTESTSQIVKYFEIREEALHTALSDAEDMAEIYLRMVKKFTPH